MGELGVVLKSFLKCLFEALASKFDLGIKEHLKNSKSK